MFRGGSLPRSRPFNIHSFFDTQRSNFKMGNDSEKERVSADFMRSKTGSPILPTTSPMIEKIEPPSSNVHPALYVM